MIRPSTQPLPKHLPFPLLCERGRKKPFLKVRISKGGAQFEAALLPPCSTRLLGGPPAGFAVSALRAGREELCRSLPLYYNTKYIEKWPLGSCVSALERVVCGLLLPTPFPKQKQLREKRRPDLIPFAREQWRELWGWLMLDRASSLRTVSFPNSWELM